MLHLSPLEVSRQKRLSYVFTLTEDLGLVKLHLFLLKGYNPI